MRGLVVVALAACGRLAFDPFGDGDASVGDGMRGDGVSNGELCNGRDDNGNAVVDELACDADCAGIDRAGRGYMLCNTSVTWFAARDRCVQAGMTLVRVDDATENAFIRTYVDPLANPQAWLGANDVELEGTWRWLDGTQFWQGSQTGMPVAGLYNSWQSNQPDDRQAVEDCAESFPQGLWGDQPCNDAAALDVVFCEQL